MNTAWNAKYHTTSAHLVGTKYATTNHAVLSNEQSAADEQEVRLGNNSASGRYLIKLANGQSLGTDKLFRER